MTSSIESKREEFRKYLEESGVVNALTKALIKLYEEPDKPECAIRYVREKMCETCPTEAQFELLKTDFDTHAETIVNLERELASVKGSIKRTPSEVMKLLDEGITALATDEGCNGLLKKYLTEELYEQLKPLKTALGSTLLDCIQSGLENHDSSIGVYASDAECYTIFADLYDPIIEEYHIGFNKEMSQPELNWGDPTTFNNLDPEGKYVISTRIRCARSIEGFPFNTRMTEQQYQELLASVSGILENLEGDFKGQFHSLIGMEKDVRKELIQNHFLFKDGDRFLKSARACRFWPIGRGVFFNADKTFLVWVNEEDHLRFISMQPGGDLGTVYQRLMAAVQECSAHLTFVRHPRLGFLTFCPSNLGTTIRASVHIKMPLLSEDLSKMEEVATKYNLQIRGFAGEHSEPSDGIYDISNRRRLGLTEFEAVQEMYNGILELIKMEKELDV